jgi:ATP-dependent Clp protease ATP-binding subunit ClpA
VEIQMAHLADRLAEQHIELVLSDSARDLIARQGYDPVYGARPLKRVIQRQIENPWPWRYWKATFWKVPNSAPRRKGIESCFRQV